MLGSFCSYSLWKLLWILKSICVISVTTSSALVNYFKENHILHVIITVWRLPVSWLIKSMEVPHPCQFNPTSAHRPRCEFNTFICICSHNISSNSWLSARIGPQINLSLFIPLISIISPPLWSLSSIRASHAMVRVPSPVRKVSWVRFFGVYPHP